MKDSTLLFAAVITGMIGIIGLYFLSDHLELEYSSISEIKEMEDYDIVRVNGTISRVFQKGNFTMITLSRTEFIKVVVFENITVNKGEKLEVVGQVKDYKGEKEVIAEKISKG